MQHGAGTVQDVTAGPPVSGDSARGIPPFLRDKAGRLCPDEGAANAAGRIHSVIPVEEL